MATKNAPTKREKHPLLKRHKHRGKWLEEGAEIELRPHQALRLRKAQKIK